MKNYKINHSAQFWIWQHFKKKGWFIIIDQGKYRCYFPFGRSKLLEDWATPARFRKAYRRMQRDSKSRKD